MEKTAQINKRSLKKLFFFTTIIFLISLHDGIMSYIAPVFLEKYLNDTFLVGVVLSISSIFGIGLNFFVAKKLSNKSYNFFLKWMIFFGILFPIFLYFLPKRILFFAISMITWSVYYEYRNYAKFNYTSKNLDKKHHTKAWSIFQTYQSLAYMLGPVFVVALISYSLNAPLLASVITVFFTFIIGLVFCIKDRKCENSKNTKKPSEERPKTSKKEFKIIEIIGKKIWPLVLFNFAVSLFDVAIWSIGILFAEKLRKAHELGGWFIVLFSFPQIFVGLIAPHIHNKLGKKRTSFITGILAGASMLFLGMNSNIFVILGLILFGSTFYGLTVILISAVFEDYVSRMDIAKNDIVSMNQISLNLAYSIGPMGLAFITKFWGYGTAFISVGLIIIVSATISALLIPRKIRLPQKEVITELAS